MTEADLKGALTKELRLVLKGALIFRHEDKFTFDIPDLSVTWLGRTTWFEVKHCNPSLPRDKSQEFTMLQLAGAGYARYILYETTRCLIVHPRNILNWSTDWDAMFTGNDHRAIANHIRNEHARGRSLLAPT